MCTCCSERKNISPPYEENNAPYYFKLSRGVRTQFVPGNIPSRNFTSALWDKVVACNRTVHATRNIKRWHQSTGKPKNVVFNYVIFNIKKLRCLKKYPKTIETFSLSQVVNKVRRKNVWKNRMHSCSRRGEPSMYIQKPSGAAKTAQMEGWRCR